MKEFFQNKKRLIIIAVTLIAVVTVGTVYVKADAVMKAESYKADVGQLSSVLEINGNVESNTQKTYYAKVDGLIDKVNVKEGDFVKKGDVIVSFDLEEIERLTAIAEYCEQADVESYNNSIQTGSRTASLYQEAKNNLEVLDSLIATTEITLLQRQKDLAQKSAALADEGAKLQISLIDWEDEPDSEEYENLRKLVQSNAYDQQHSADIIKIQEDIDSLNVYLTELKTAKSEMTSQKAATQMGLMTNGAKKELEAMKAANELASNNTIENYNEAAEGIIAEFDGIVSSIKISEGSNVFQGTELVTVKSLDDVIIKLNVNKYDIVNIEENQTASVVIKNKKYNGKVSRIARMTDESGQNSGIDVEVKLDEPDSDIILGLDVKTQILTANINDALRIPVEALWEDEEGSFVFVAQEEKAVKTKVEVGVRNDDMVEITEGISEGDLVVWNENSEITDGMCIKID